MTGPGLKDIADRYEILGDLGDGGMGMVRKARGTTIRPVFRLSSSGMARASRRSCPGWARSSATGRQSRIARRRIFLTLNNVP